MVPTVQATAIIANVVMLQGLFSQVSREVIFPRVAFAPICGTSSTWFTFRMKHKTRAVCRKKDPGRVAWRDSEESCR
jgi:hypothetical protein